MEWIHLIGNFLYRVGISLGGPGLFLIALADSSFLSLPEGNDILIIVLSTGQSWELMAYYVLTTTLGSVVGCSILFSLGRKGGSFIDRRLKKQRMDDLKETFGKWGILAVLIPSILPPPTPFKIFVLSAGIFQVPYRKFLFAAFTGRLIRYSTWGILAVLYGEWARQFLEENLGEASIAVTILLLTVIITYFVVRIRRHNIYKEETHEIV